MKIMFLADIHGSARYTAKALEIFEKEGASHLAILGDMLNRGGWSRPEEYNPDAVARLLNQYAHITTAVKGNCDSAEDADALDFPFLSEYSSVLCDGTRFFLTHGHIYNRDNFPAIKSGDVFIQGHTHSAGIECTGGKYIINPGSISLPKGGAEHSLGLLDGNVLRLQTINGGVLSEIKLDCRKPHYP